MADNDTTPDKVLAGEYEDLPQAMIRKDEPDGAEGKVISAARERLTLSVNRLAMNLCELMDGMRHLSITQAEINDQMAIMEKTIRLHTTVTPKQVRLFNSAIREAAKTLLQKRGADGDRKANTLLCNAIRRAVTRRYGVAALHEIPKHEYPVVLSQIATWNDALEVRAALKRARGEDA